MIDEDEQIKHAKHAKPAKSGKNSFVSFLLMIVLIAGLAVGIRVFVMQAYEIPSRSMESTLQVGDLLFSEKISYLSGQPKVGDIVTFDDPAYIGTSNERVLIKRVVATAGQTVNLVDGKVVVDGQVLDEPYTNGLPSNPLAGSKITFPYVVPDNCVFVMGDNRTNSQDSRWFGGIDVKTITGHAFLIYWPINRFSLFD